MPLDLQVTAITPPEGTPFPGTVRDLIAHVAEYSTITGGETATPANFGQLTPPRADVDKPWLKTAGGYNALAWYGWGGSKWVLPVMAVDRGLFADAPGGATQGQLYYATDGIGLCRYDKGAWVTAQGRTGDVIYVRGSSSSAILAKYPGWTLITDVVGCVFRVAGETAHLPETHVGAENHTNTKEEMPTHDHSPYVVNGSNTEGTQGLLNVLSAGNSIGFQQPYMTMEPVGGGAQYSIMNPTFYLYAIQKT